MSSSCCSANRVSFFKELHTKDACNVAVDSRDQDRFAITCGESHGFCIVDMIYERFKLIIVCMLWLQLMLD